MRRFVLSALILLLALSLNARVEEVASFSALEFSPFTSFAYYGEYQDIFSNPATLSLREDDGAFQVSFKLHDNVNFDTFGEKMGWLQDHLDQTTLSFSSRYVALSVMFGASFEDRTLLSSGNPLFNIFSNTDIEVDFGYAFPYFAIGANLKGGNSMARNSREIGSFWDAICNAWFSPFDRFTGRERFSLGLGMLLYFKNISLGVNIGEIFSLQSGYLEFSLEGIGNSTSISLAVEGNRFNRNGDLNIVKPRASITYSGFSNRPIVSYLKIAGELDFLFLPTSELDIGFSYLEREHRFFFFERDRGEMSIYLRGTYIGIKATLGITLDTKDFNTISPFFLFTYEM